MGFPQWLITSWLGSAARVKYKVIYGWRKMHKSLWIIFRHPFVVVVVAYLDFFLFFLLLKMNKLEKLVVSPLGIEMDVP